MQVGIRSVRRLGAGFTLVEFVVVLVMIGILAAVAAPPFFDDRTFVQRGYYEELAAALKYAQKLAVASGCPVRVVIDASGYEARQQAAAAGNCTPTDGSWATGVRLADSQLLAGASPFGVTASPALTLTFDPFGRTDLPADRSVSVGPFTLTIEADSGFVQAP